MNCNCFTLTPVGLTEGIAVHHSNSFGEGVRLGSKEHSGRERFVRFDRDSRPRCEGVHILRAAIKAPRSSWVWFFVKAQTSEESVLIRIETGSPSDVGHKISHGILRKGGSPRRIDSGRKLTELGVEISREELWQLSPHDVIEVIFISGVRVQIENKDRTLHCKYFSQETTLPIPIVQCPP